MDYFHYSPDRERYERFLVSGLDDYSRLCFRSAEPLAATWSPVQLAPDYGKRRKKPPPTSDFPYVNTFTPLFSERAWQTLRPLVEFDAEALPVRGGDRLFHAIHVLRIASGVLDLDRAQYSLNSYVNAITWVRKYVLRASAIPR